MSNKVSHDSETPAHGKQVISVVGFIHRIVDGEPQVLLAKRAATKKFLPGKWEMPGGHVDFGEDIVTALTREVDEEFGVGLEVGDCFYCFTYMNNVKGSHSVEAVFFAKLTEADTNISLNPEDHSEWRWLTRADIEAIRSEIDASGESDSLELHTAEDPEWLALCRGFEVLTKNT